MIDGGHGLDRAEKMSGECDDCGNHCLECECRTTKKRLRWALRYVMCHPDMTPEILADEWKIDMDDAISLCANNVGVIVADFGLGYGETCLKKIEERIWDKLKAL